MVRTVHIKKPVLANLALISDISWSWQCLKEYSQKMQEKIKKSPKTALLLKATFMKLSSIMNSPMVRIIQANSPDFLSVSKFYSSELIKFVKGVLQVNLFYLVLLINCCFILTGIFFFNINKDYSQISLSHLGRSHSFTHNQAKEGSLENQSIRLEGIRPIRGQNENG